MNESIEPSRRATFRAATKGLRAYTVALKLARAKVRPGIDFRGCTKRQLEDDFATEGGLLREVSGELLRDAMTMRP